MISGSSRNSSSSSTETSNICKVEEVASSPPISKSVNTSTMKSSSSTSASSSSTNKTQSTSNSSTRKFDADSSNNHSLGLGFATTTDKVSYNDRSKPNYYDAAQKILKDTYTASMNPATFTGRNQISSKNLPKDLQGQLEIEMDPSLYCRHFKPLA